MLNSYKNNKTNNRSSKSGSSCGNHIYGLASAAFNTMLETNADQAIVVSGESGAGKTENTKKCLQFIAAAAASNSSNNNNNNNSMNTIGLEERLLSANPILEAFGNAKTLRNDNSSRFGKWIKMFFQKGTFYFILFYFYYLHCTKIFYLFIYLFIY